MATTEDILDRVVEIQKTSAEAFQRLEGEVRELKDSRFRPYFASAGAFLVVVMGVMSYVYSLETRLNGLLFEIHASVNVGQERVDVLEDRLEARSSSMHVRWETHAGEHERLSRAMALLLDHLLDEAQIKLEHSEKSEKEEN
jgi:hypothetical protein